MIARLALVALLMFIAVACEKEIHEVRLDDRFPQEKLTELDVPVAADRI